MNIFLSEEWWKNATIEDIKTILNDGADVNKKNDNGMTPLMYAVSNWYNDDPETIKILVRHGADINE